MSLFKLNDPTLISASALEALLTSGKITIGQFGLGYGPHFTNQELGANIWYAAPQAALGTNAVAIGTLTFVPFFTGGRSLILAGLGFVTTALGTAGSVARVGIYDSDLTTLKPTQLLADGGQVATDAGSNLVMREATTAEISLKPYSLYWGAYLCGVAAPTVQSSSPATLSPLGFQSSSSGPGANYGFSAAFAYAALPAQAPAVILSGSPGGFAGGAVYLRFSRPA